ncbi:Pyrimidine dimer DNA glycosylase domain-containing protein [Desulfonema limicola]|uniref:Pyrimidine dimer DNA glycosylase domain-containing protein n=1 Tax=Desulfonema limicola TaxID=45656 RepID=A0A975B672_9BACT|nr:pyrimidine dimer DNA glycosylase/endonuclease V [Desulfonema limicola]QTA79570.1 Pyrimidine dimer DNA glycosylase domain-containing protein [Desulfonema limicola]
MRIWDINPGYLNRQSLLGEHRELHGIVSIITNNKKGYSAHPETLRWTGYVWALKKRHDLLASEMSLRGYKDKSPVNIISKKKLWPDIYIDKPFQQFKILESKYKNREQGRIPLPLNVEQLWNQHKYSALARGVNLCNKLDKYDFSGLSDLLIKCLRIPPAHEELTIVIQQMWRHVSPFPCPLKKGKISWSLSRIFKEIQKKALENKDSFLVSSTVLSDLDIFI